MSASEMTCYTERLGPYVLSPILRENDRRIILVSYKGDIRTIQGRPHRTLSLCQALELDFKPGDMLQFLPDKYWPECYDQFGEGGAGPTRPFKLKGLRGGGGGGPSRSPDYLSGIGGSNHTLRGPIRRSDLPAPARCFGFRLFSAFRLRMGRL